jgi:hypothetical protein
MTQDHAAAAAAAAAAGYEQPGIVYAQQGHMTAEQMAEAAAAHAAYASQAQQG